MLYIRLMCLHLVKQWYNIFLTVYRKRKYISKNTYIIALILTCFLFGPVYAKNQTEDQLKTWKSDIVQETSIKNITIIPFVKDEKIYLRVSWDKEGEIPEYYKLELQPLHKKDHCEDTTSAYLSGVSKTNITFGEMQVHPDCPYELTIIPNPRLTKVGLKVNYTVPDCLENRCSCKKIHRLPKPELKFNILNSYEYEILLTITADKQWLSSNNLSTVRYRFINNNHSGDDLEFNETISNENANNVKQLRVNKTELDYGSSYQLKSTIIDVRQCEIAATKLDILTSASPALPAEKEFVKNLQIYPYFSEENQCIELNITWEKVSADWYPEGYGFKITSLSTEGHCTEANDHEVFNIAKTATTAIINQTKIVPGCNYTMELMPQPHNSNIGPHLNITIPDCVGKICSCPNDLLIDPKIINIKSSIKRIEIKYKIIAGPIWLLENNLTDVTFHFFNGFKSQSFKKFLSNSEANKNLNFTINISALLPPKNYDFKIIVNNNRNCPVTSRIVHFKLPLSPKQQPLHWVFTVMIPTMFILMFSGVLVIFMKQRKCCWVLRKLCFLNNQCPAQTHVRRIYRPTNPDCNRGRPYLSVPMEYNNLYIEKEILDEMDRGKVDKYEISYSRLKFEHKIGGGAFGQVFLAMTTAISGVPGFSAVAVKTLKKSATPEELEEFLLEIAMLKQIGQHPNIVRLLGCCTIKHPYCMIMEYIPCGDLSRYLQALRVRFEKKNKSFDFSHSFNSSASQESQKISESSYIQPENMASTRLPSVTETEYTLLSSEGVPLTPNTPRRCTPAILECELDPKELQNFALQIAKGMEYLESKQIVHRDLAARNVLIDENKVLKISDFGLSRSGIYVNTKHKTVPLRWLSVEAIRDNLYTSKSDVWAYAIVLWEIGTLGAFPYPAIANHELLGFLLKGKRLEKPENCTDELYNLMLKCWAHSGDERPSFSELVRYLESISSRKRVYVDFSQLNPSYMFPPTEEQSVTLMKTENNIKTIEIILTDK